MSMLREPPSHRAALPHAIHSYNLLGSPLVCT